MLLVFLNVSLKPSMILEKCLLLYLYVELLRPEHCDWLIFIQFCCQVLLLLASTSANPKPNMNKDCSLMWISMLKTNRK